MSSTLPPKAKTLSSYSTLATLFFFLKKSQNAQKFSNVCRTLQNCPIFSSPPETLDSSFRLILSVLHAVGTPKKNVNARNVSKGPVHACLKSCAKKGPVCACFEKGRKHSGPSRCKMTEQLLKTVSKGCKNHESRRTSSSQSTPNSSQTPKKQQRKGDNPVRLPSSTELPPDDGCPSTWICKNSACRAVLSSDDTFCKRCSCCICHLFDDNKDPSLWLVCTSESAERDSCGQSCHIECALQRQKVGVADLGEFMQLDGSYCCASCGKVSGIIGCWRKQLVIAKDARRVDVLCYRISLSHRLLDGTSRFKELHDIIGDAKAKIETEVGPVNGVSAKMARGIVSRLSVAGDVQKLCSLAIEKADAWLSSSQAKPTHREDSLPAACKFQFEDMTSSSLVIVLKETCSSSLDNIEGYKLWYCKSLEEPHQKEPICVFPKDQRRILISNLQPCTEYTFRIISFTETGDFGHSEAKCFTKSVEIIHKNADSTVAADRKSENVGVEGSSSGAKKEPKISASGSSGFKVRDLGKILRLAWAQEEGCFDGFCNADLEECCGGDGSMKPETVDDDQPPVDLRELDLNVVSVPDLNAAATPPFESSRDEDIGCTSERAVEAEDDINSGGMEKNGRAKLHGSGDSETWAVRPIREVPAVESRTEVCKKRSPTGNEEAYDCDSTLINGSPLRITSRSNCLDGTYEYCVKIIRWLECGGHIERDFRMKFLTWFSLRSTEKERRVVNTFIQTLVDDPSSLAGQLVDSFLDIVSCKRPRHGFCSKLWH